MEKLLLSPEEAAHALGVGRSRVYDLMRTRQLLSVRIGKSRRVPVADPDHPQHPAHNAQRGHARGVDRTECGDSGTASGDRAR
jgi:excisionase family DNA binding protein